MDYVRGFLLPLLSLLSCEVILDSLSMVIVFLRGFCEGDLLQWWLLPRPPWTSCVVRSCCVNNNKGGTQFYVSQQYSDNNANISPPRVCSVTDVTENIYKQTRDHYPEVRTHTLLSLIHI